MSKSVPVSPLLTSSQVSPSTYHLDLYALNLRLLHMDGKNSQAHTAGLRRTNSMYAKNP